MQKVTSRSSTGSSICCWLVGISLLVVIVLVQLAGFTHAEATTARTQVSDEALDKALSDKRYLMRQLKCALGEVPCDPVGKRLKSKYSRPNGVTKRSKKKENTAAYWTETRTD
uniref:Uncharacterized protein n=1 Tax=Anopheles maculatus TaxID=74869 RepID=A0A182S9C6_9DIPT